MEIKKKAIKETKPVTATPNKETETPVTEPLKGDVKIVKEKNQPKYTKAPFIKAKYSLNEKKIENYLKGAKPADTIVQISRGGNFVSAKNKSKIYIPLSLILNK